MSNIHADRLEYFIIREPRISCGRRATQSEMERGAEDMRE